MLQPKLISVIPLPESKLRLTYETGEVKLFDVSPYIKGSWFGMLKDETYFRTVHLLSGGTGIEWGEGQDIAPHELYELSVSDPSWDPDYTKVTPEERKAIEEAEKGEFIPEEDIDWDHLEKYASI